MQEINQQHKQFYLKLFHSFQPNQNLIFSPLSIYQCLSMAAVGARENTLKEFKTVLQFEDINHILIEHRQLVESQKNTPQIAVSNKLYHCIENLEQEFLQIMNSEFKGSIDYTDFLNHHQESIDKINSWVEQSTKGMIKDIVNPQNLSPFTKLAIVNAIFFKDDWLYKFEKKSTFQDKFFFPSKLVEQKGMPFKMIDMMTQTKFFNYFEDKDIQYLQLPYQNKNLMMEIILPKIQHDNDHSFLNEQRIQQARQSASTQEIELYLPRFKLEDKVARSLVEILKQIGLRDCFEETVANFDGIWKDGGLFIYEVLHKAMIEVTESGTKAAAATAVLFTDECECDSISQTIQVKCNRPFIFSIIDSQSNKPYFMGKVVDPESMPAEEEEQQKEGIQQFFGKIFSKFF